MRSHAVIRAALALAVGCSAPDLGSSEPAITEGADDGADPAVVGLLFDGDAQPLRCTGTLIDERVVLTAAHCGADVDPSAVGVFFGSDLGTGGTRVALLDAIAHPDYADSADHDLALLLLADPPPSLRSLSRPTRAWLRRLRSRCASSASA